MQKINKYISPYLRFREQLNSDWKWHGNHKVNRESIKTFAFAYVLYNNFRWFLNVKIVKTWRWWTVKVFFFRFWLAFSIYLFFNSLVLLCENCHDLKRVFPLYEWTNVALEGLTVLSSLAGVILLHWHSLEYTRNFINWVLILIYSS